MQHEIKKYPVRHPLLRKYIKFFWALQIDDMQLNHKLVPQRNINLRFNLSETPQFICVNNEEHAVEEVFFSGLHDHYTSAHLKMNGRVDILGVCFLPEGFFPFLKIPVSEFKNQLLGANEVGFKQAGTITDRLKEAPGIEARLNILEHELALMLDAAVQTPENFRRIFNAVKQSDSPVVLAEFCQRNNIGMRQLERMYNKYIGVSAMTYNTLDRFHSGLNQLLSKDYSKLSDIAYGNGYFDQMHYIREFKRFAGDTPGSFVHQKNSILQIGKMA